MASAGRTLRVFVCSTYEDMQAERDYLATEVFPPLRAELRAAQVELVDVDLYADVSREQTLTAEIFPFGLEQVDECRPFFLALVGARYGWRPEGYPAGLTSRFPWIDSEPRSLFDLAVSHAALNDNAWMSQALFCLRDPAVLESIPESIRRRDYLETQPQHQALLQDLLRRISSSGYPIERYTCTWKSHGPISSRATSGHLTGLESFGQQVTTWLRFAIQAELKRLRSDANKFSRDEVALEKEQQRRYLERCRRHHIVRNEVNSPLLAYSTSEASDLCQVAGHAGCGKSASLAYFVHTFRMQHPRDLVLAHFVQGTIRLRGFRELVGWLCTRIQHSLKLRLVLPEGGTERLVTLQGLLQGIPAHIRLVMVLDGLEDLATSDAVRLLRGLPYQLRPNIKMIVSVRQPCSRLESQEPLAQALGLRPLQVIEVPAWDKALRLQRVAAFPHLAVRGLQTAKIQELVEKPQTQNPLYLTLALQECRAGPAGTTASPWLAQLPGEGHALERLCEAVLRRCELEFDRELVPTTLALLVCARRGLSEDELSVLTQDCQLHGKLFLLLRWLRPYLWCSGGQLTIDHQLLREAVWRYYLKRGPHATMPAPEETVIRTRLARYFGNREVDARQLEEVPWQLQEMQAWEPLFELLSDVPYLAQLNQHCARDVRSYWNQLTTHSTLRITDAYRSGLVNPARIEPHVELVARLFEENKQLDATLILFNYLARTSRRKEDHTQLAHALAGQARIHLQRADYPQAELILAEYAILSRQLGDLAGLQFALTKQAFVQRKQQHYQAALDLHRQEEQVCRESNATHAVAMSLINQAHLLADRLDNPAAALPLAEDAHVLALRHGFHNLAEQVRIRLVRIQHQVCHPQQTAESPLDPSSRFFELPDSGLGF